MTRINDLLDIKQNQLSKEGVNKDLLILADIVIDLFLAQKRANKQTLQPNNTISYTKYIK